MAIFLAGVVLLSVCVLTLFSMFQLVSRQFLVG